MYIKNLRSYQRVRLYHPCKIEFFQAISICFITDSCLSPDLSPLSLPHHPAPPPSPEPADKICSHFFYLSCSFTACLFRQILSHIYPSTIWTRTVGLDCAAPSVSVPDKYSPADGGVFWSLKPVWCAWVSVTTSIFHLTMCSCPQPMEPRHTGRPLWLHCNIL